MTILKSKEIIHLIRANTNDQGTKGFLLTSMGVLCCSIELPWRENETNISCIPFGEYDCEPYTSRKFGSVYHVLNVEGRTWILTHTGNYAGDTSKGFKSHSAGCILLGKYHGLLNGQRAVLSSKPAFRKFRDYIGQNEFKLIVREKP